MEKVLISVLLDSSSSPLTCITFLYSILQKLKLTTFSIPTHFITMLSERLTYLLSPSDQVASDKSFTI